MQFTVKAVKVQFSNVCFHLRRPSRCIFWISSLSVLSIIRQFSVPSALIILWFIVLFMQPDPAGIVAENGAFALLGVIGAVFANATGAGGGVVFVPVFHHLDFSPQNIVATSFAIQCCGMTAGALSWWAFFQNKEKHNEHWQMLPQVVALTVPASVCGILMAQFAAGSIPLLSFIQGNVNDLHLGFGIFSIFLALVIFASIPLLKKTRFRSSLSMTETALLPVVAFVGGAVTAWLSVGVGELVAVFLILRGFHVTMAIAVAVMLTAFSVWGGVIYHVTESLAIVWPVVLFAGAGAIIGGRLAKYVVLAFSVQKLKLFFGLWVLLLGISGLPVF